MLVKVLLLHKKEPGVRFALGIGAKDADAPFPLPDWGLTLSGVQPILSRLSTYAHSFGSLLSC